MRLTETPATLFCRTSRKCIDDPVRPIIKDAMHIASTMFANRYYPPST
ncbi:MAG: hypothetical protein KDJ36_15675 [Hyphomicrobiaceae bacterium]|nr:hypothetical protein [Hyphomicrobiaceae bacterium]